MYFKKILLAVVLIGLVIAGYFAYYVYSTMFTPNTAFNNDEAYIFLGHMQHMMMLGEIWSHY